MSLRPPVSASDHHLGPLDAPLQLVEYGDYECPYCGALFPEIAAIRQAFSDNLCFVFRHFPLSEAHPHAERAAEMAEAAASEGKFWQMHEVLFQNQDALDDESLVAYGEQLGLSEAAIRSAFDGSREQHVRHDFTGGVRSGVNGTPSLFINGTRYDGAQDAQSIADALAAVG